MGSVFLSLLEEEVRSCLELLPMDAQECQLDIPKEEGFPFQVAVHLRNTHPNDQSFIVKGRLFVPPIDRHKQQRVLCSLMLGYFVGFFLTCGLVNIVVILVGLVLGSIYLCLPSTPRNNHPLRFNVEEKLLETPHHGNIPFKDVSISPEYGINHSSIAIYGSDQVQREMSWYESLIRVPITEDDPKYLIMEEDSDIDELRRVFDWIASCEDITADESNSLWESMERISEFRRSSKSGSKRPNLKLLTKTRTQQGYAQVNRPDKQRVATLV